VTTASTSTSFFVEASDVVHYASKNGTLTSRTEHDRGYAITTAFADGARHQRWAALSTHAEAVATLPGHVAQHAEPLFDRAPPPSANDLLARTSTVGRELGMQAIEIRGRLAQQVVVVGARDRCAVDHREHHVIAVDVRAGDDSAAVGRREITLPSRGFEGLAELVVAAIREAAEDARAKIDRVPCPTGTLPVVIALGSDAGAWLHELLAHPLEGDVVAAGMSYLTRHRGQQICGENITVMDDPTRADRSVSYAIDDEGCAARSAILLDRGVVAEPILDARAAHALRLQPNGHGRRTSHRRPVLCRATHTMMLAGSDGTLEQLLQPVADGLFVTGLSPRHMDLATGAFSFYITEARQIAHGQLGAFVGPGLLRGTAIDALGAITAVGSVATNWFGMLGCRKLDGVPLAVSFGGPPIRLGAQRVEAVRE
jgi:TldD protein